MLFRKRKTDEPPAQPEAPTADVRLTIQHSSAETAHLIGPGCVKLRGDIPIWKPVSGQTISLHPKYLKRLFCYGNVDISTAVLQLFWKQGIVVSFLSRDSRRMVGKLQPLGGRPNLARLQHLAAEDADFAIAMAREIVRNKIDATTDAVRYYQQQGKGHDAGSVLVDLKRISARVDSARQRSELHGLEGQAASAWFRYLACLLPTGWEFNRRSARPPADPVNALLSLGYTLATTRCGALLAAADLDPLVGFLHELRPGRPSLACDLVESLRVPLVDRMVLNMLSRKQLDLRSFVQAEDGWRLQPDVFKDFLNQFETEFHQDRKPASFHLLTCEHIEDWVGRIGRFAPRSATRGGE